jgi:hypothetical protein
MRKSLVVALPIDATGRQLAALAVLADQLGAARWADLAHSFGRLGQRGAHVPDGMGQLLGELAAGLRRAADDRERAAT